MIRRELSPAMIGSVLLHVTIAVLFMISWNFSRDLKAGSIVPVTIVSSAPDADLRPAVQAPEPQAAQVDEPVPDAPLESAAPVPQPTPTPPVPAPKTVKPAEKLPAVKPAPRTKPEKGLDLDALSASVSKMVRPSAPKPSSAAKGPARPETALAARQTVGTGVSAATLAGLVEELQRRWKPNCSEDGRNIVVKVGFKIDGYGNVDGQVVDTEIQGRKIIRRDDLDCRVRTDRECLVQAAADRAASAVLAGAPFRNLPRQYYGQRIAVNFNPREACAR